MEIDTGVKSDIFVDLIPEFGREIEEGRARCHRCWYGIVCCLDRYWMNLSKLRVEEQ